MTGIAAIFTAGSRPAAQLAPMMAAMSERVHDVRGEWSDGCFALGALVLHTTAESLEAPQPLVNEDESLAIVMDGYLTNWEQLNRDLAARGAVLRNRTDHELVLRAYEQWGEDCADRIEGEFAFVIADNRARRIYAARDHQGLRPLYLHQDGERLLIASDIAPIIAALGKPPRPNEDFLAAALSGHFYQPEATVWREVSRAPSGHWLTFDGSALRRRRYYEIPAGPLLRYRREEEYAEHYREMLFDAVRRTSRSHRPLAVAVSGGLDSSSIYCIADRLEREGRLAAPGFGGYTLAGAPGTAAYELPYARAAAEHCGRSLVEVPLFRPPIDWFTERARRDCDLPIPQNGAMSIGLEQRASADGARAILNGIGGDQWLDGSFEYYSEYAGAFDLRGFLRALARDARQVGLRSIGPRALRFGASAFLPMGLRRAVRRRRREQRYRDPRELYWLAPAWRERLLEIEESFVAQLPEEPRAQGVWNRVLSPWHHVALDFMQRQRAQSGLESREPMQTRQFIAFCASLPKATLHEAGSTKVLHRQAMRGILPDLITDRRDKAEFSAPDLMLDFARFALGHSSESLATICDAGGMKRLLVAESALELDYNKGWEIWGHYAVAAILAESA